MKGSDAKAVASLLRSEFGKDYTGYVSFTPAYVLSKVREKTNTLFVARECGEVIGVCRISKVDLDLAELRWVAVIKEYRRKGVALELVRHAFTIAKKTGIRKVVSRTRAQDMAAGEFHKSLGFKEEGHFKDHFRKGTDIIQWAKFLR